MDARHLDTFHAVLRHGSLLATARAMNCAQSTITIRIQELEREIGAALFIRKGRRAALTEAGRAVFERTAQIAETIAGLKDVAAGYEAGAAGHVRIGVIEPTASFRLPAALAAFCARRPNLHLAVEVGGANRVTQLVTDGDVDFGISSPPAVESSLDFELLFEEKMGLLVPRRHPLAARSRIAPADLRDHSILLTDRSCAYRRIIESALRLNGVTPRSAIEAGSVQALRELVNAGLGIAILPIKGAPPSPRSVLRRIHGVSLALPVGLVTRPGYRPTPAQEAVRARLRARLRA